MNQQAETKRVGEPGKLRAGQLVLLSVMVMASLAVRVAAWKHWGTGAIESEGAEYARIADNLRHGAGYVGIATPGPELMFPPLYPLLIGAFSLFTGNSAAAGRLVSLVLGALLPLPVMGIASRLFNRGAALIAGALVVLHPLLVNLSFTVMTEGPYPTLLLSAVYLALLAFESPAISLWCATGAAFGVAFLMRQEAVAPLLIAAFFAFVTADGALWSRCQRPAAALAAFLLLAAPEVLFLYRHTGKWKLEAKSAITLPLASRILDAEPLLCGARDPFAPACADALRWAGDAVDENLNRTGIWLRPEVEVLRDSRVSLQRTWEIVYRGIRQNTPVLVQQLSSKWMGGPLLLALALLGAFRRPWRGPRALARLYFALVPATVILASFTVLWPFSRYYFSLVPFLLLWAANGLFELGLWTGTSTLAAGWFRPVPRMLACMVPLAAGLALVIYPVRGVRGLYEFKEGSPGHRGSLDAGLWIKGQQPGPVTVMDRYTPLAFHAGAQFVYFPYCSGAVALRFLDAAGVDYVVLRRDENYAPYYQEWLQRGIPDPRARLVYPSSDTAQSDLLVFRWDRLARRGPGAAALNQSTR